MTSIPAPPPPKHNNMTPEQMRDALVEYFYNNRMAAHEYLFAHRRKNNSPEFHHDILKLFYSGDQYVLAEAFRGGAKTTLAEEYTLLSILFRDFKFAIIVGNAYDRACERLAAIKNEIETNEAIVEIFGSQVGGTWTANEIILANGAKIQAFGAKQSLRGAKHNDDRPDLAVVDDLEDEEMVATELARNKAQRWFNGGLLPALVPWGKVRMVGTPLHPKSLLENKRKDSKWKSIVVPALVVDHATGAEQSSWPDRFSTEHLQGVRHNYQMAGSLLEFEQEYMCRSEDVANKPFQPSMIKAAPVPIGYHPVEIFVDPARTVKTTSARTGYAVWSWVGTKLYVHEAFGAFHKPDEIIDTIFKLNDKYNPVTIGVERDGLEEFIMQPLRAEQVKRGVSIPLAPMKAPRDKVSFITSLQPFYLAGDVFHVQACPDLESELLAFPTGRVDVPNALAYALRMRVGQIVYPDFTSEHIHEGMAVDRRAARYLAVNATPSMTAAVLLQFKDGNMRILKDWVRNEPAQEAMPLILPEVVLAGGEFTAVTPYEQMDKYVNYGIPAAFKHMRGRLIRGAHAAKSIGVLAPRLKTTNRGRPAFEVSVDAVRVVNGLLRGYARKLLPTGGYDEYPEENQYALLIGAIESFAGYINSGMVEEQEDVLWSQTADGRDFISTLPRRT